MLSAVIFVMKMFGRKNWGWQNWQRYILSVFLRLLYHNVTAFCHILCKLLSSRLYTVSENTRHVIFSS